MADQWLKCDIVKGMFSDELAVTVRTRSGGEVSVFVPKEAVRGAIDQPGEVRVRVVREHDTPWAILPTEYSDAVPVNDGDILQA